MLDIFSGILIDSSEEQYEKASASILVTPLGRLSDFNEVQL